MSASELPGPVHELLLQHVESLEQLEVLLLLQRERRALTAAQVATGLRISPTATPAHLERLVRAGLLSAGGGPDPAYQYAPRDERLADATSQLVRTYAERRLVVVNFIATRHLERIRSFASAFRWKKGDG